MALRVPFGWGPGLDGVVGQGVVTIFAGIVDAATFHLDGDNVGGAMVVEAAGFWIKVESRDFGRECRHGRSTGSGEEHSKMLGGMRMFDCGKRRGELKRRKTRGKTSKKITKAPRSAEKSESKADPSLSLKTHRSSAPIVRLGMRQRLGRGRRSPRCNGTVQWDGAMGRAQVARWRARGAASATQLAGDVL